jgi:1-deoxyxylulose-5-phosphate synthase
VLDLAFGWLLTRPAVASVIAGATRPEQVTGNVAAGTWRPDADVLAAVDTIAPR